MSEKKYLICEYGVWPTADGKEVITENELKWRLAYIAGFFVGECGSMEKEIAVLLHGEGERGDFTEAAYKTSTEDKEAVMLVKPAPTPTRENGEVPESHAHLLNPHMGVGRLREDKPSTTHTREEWEAWIDNMPVTLDCKLDILNTHDFRAWFRAMPIIPKE